MRLTRILVDTDYFLSLIAILTSIDESGYLTNYAGTKCSLVYTRKK